MSSRQSAITAAGMVLSQPTRHTSPSSRWPRATSSIESAIVSRETSDARIPSVPIETPSETAIVLNSTGVPPASTMPRRTCRASSRWFQLHGIVSIQLVAMPTSGRASAASSKPIPFSIARAGARSTPSVSAALCRFAGSVGPEYGSLMLLRAVRSSVDRGSEPLDAGERAQLVSHLLDLGGAFLSGLAQLGEVRPARLVVREELAGERAASHLGEDLAERVPDAVVDDPGSPRQIAVLGDVGDRVPHVLVPALVEEVDDELQLDLLYQ